MKYLRGAARIWAYTALIVGLGIAWIFMLLLAIYYVGGGRP